MMSSAQELFDVSIRNGRCVAKTILLKDGRPFQNPAYPPAIRDFPDHAPTFRKKRAKLACTDKLGVFLSLTLCNKANFDPLQQVKYDGLEEM